MTPQELKSSILQLAIQGKLVEQRPEEGTAEELYKQIQAEKQALIKAGKIKKEKPLPEITEDEIPFDIPDSWMWVRLGSVLTVIGGISYDKKDVSTHGYRILRGGNIQSMKVILEDNDVFLPKEYKDDDKLVRKGDILIVASTGSKTVIGKAGYVESDLYNTMIGAFLRICRPISQKYVDYLRIIFDSDFYRKHIRNLSQGTNINNVKESYITQFAIPLPPLAEQKRIVAKIEELLPLIDRYEEAWTKLENFNKRFPEDMQKSILQMAIQGKLVPQDPSEGNGEDLYKQIQAEKARLIKEGRIKKEKPLPEITVGEIPFEIPDSWKWVRLSDVIDVRDGTHATPGYVLSGYPLITGKDFYTGSFDLSKTQYISEVDYDEIRQRSNVEIGDILFSMIGGNIGSMIKITEDNFFEMAIKNVALFKHYDYQIPLTDYLFIFLKSQVKRMQSIAKGGAQSFVPLKTLRSYPFPLPPLAEQKRIVAKLEELLPLCERLK